MDLATRYRALLEQGLQASQERRGQDAIDLFTQASEAAPAEGMPHFLIASEHAAEGHTEAAERAFANAVLLAPAFHLARYQLGLLQFSSGRAGVALVTWQPLVALDAGQPLGHFVRGFAALARDAFPGALREFELGLACSGDQHALAADIERVVAAVRRLEGPASVAAGALTAAEGVAPHVLVSGYGRGLHQDGVARIDSSNALAAWVQADIAARGVRPPSPATASRAERQAAPHVAATALQRIRAIPADDPDRRRKALRIYLESTLLQAFGPQLALDGGFTQLLDAVQARMAADPQIAAAADRAAALLCDQARGG